MSDANRATKRLCAEVMLAIEHGIKTGAESCAVDELRAAVAAIAKRGGFRVTIAPRDAAEHAARTMEMLRAEAKAARERAEAAEARAKTAEERANRTEALAALGVPGAPAIAPLGLRRDALRAQHARRARMAS